MKKKDERFDLTTKILLVMCVLCLGFIIWIAIIESESSNKIDPNAPQTVTEIGVRKGCSKEPVREIIREYHHIEHTKYDTIYIHDTIYITKYKYIKQEINDSL